MDDDDAALALYVAYELHYRGLADVDDDLEWDPGILRWRADLEAAFLDDLRQSTDSPRGINPSDVPTALRELLGAGEDVPSVAAWCDQNGTHRQLREQAVLRSAYQQKEADPHSWLLPRLDGEAKAALVEIQADEYGNGRARDMHAQLFGLHLKQIGLNDGYGAWIDHVPGIALAGVNLISMFGLHRSLRGAAVGHLAHFEMSSVPVMAALSSALNRLGYDAWTRLFFDVHVVADAEHQTLAADRLVPALLADEAHLADDVVFGAHALAALESRLAVHTVGAWERGVSALLLPMQEPGLVPGLQATEPATDPRDRATIWT